MGVRTYGLILLLLAFLLVPARGQIVTARARVDSTNYLVGDWITVHIDITHPSGATFRPLLGDTLGPFAVIARDSLHTRSETETEGAVVVAKYDSGSAMLPPIPLLASIPGDSASKIVATNPLLLTVHTLQVDTSVGIKDIKPPIWISLTLAEILLYLGILLLVAVAGYLLYGYWKKRTHKKQGQEYVPPARPAYAIALEELAMLKEKKLWQRGLIKQYYSEVTEIVRRYFENRYGFMALEQTTDEIMGALRKHRHAEAIWEDAEEMLRLADLVKFAKYQPDIPEHDQTLQTAFDIVEKTRMVEPKPEEKEVTTDVAG
jgi:hypothetical protein